MAEWVWKRGLTLGGDNKKDGEASNSREEAMMGDTREFGGYS